MTTGETGAWLNASRNATDWRVTLNGSNKRSNVSVIEPSVGILCAASAFVAIKWIDGPTPLSSVGAP